MRIFAFYFNHHLQNDYTYEIALTLLPGVGCQTQRQLLDMVGSAKKLFEMSEKELNELFGTHKGIVKAILSRSLFKKVEEELAFIEKNHIHVLYYGNPDYPQRLNLPGCEDTPVILYALGDTNLNPERAVSIVGTRKATPQGIELTKKLVTGFYGEEITVFSGLALGIDAASHAAALDNSLPTVGVLGHGLDQLYPPLNRNLAKRMLANGGALVTERMSGTALSPKLFPARNRIIAALSDATIVVEASKTGGALITANIASSYHRELFAFPGRVDDKYSEGCNGIIASCKAMLIRNADDLFANMDWSRNVLYVGKQASLFPELSKDEQSIYDILQQHPEIGMDSIRELSDLPLPKIATILLNLELKDICRCLPGKLYKVVR